MDAGTATMISAGATAVYAVVAAISLLLLSRQVRDARRFGAAPALMALLKEMGEHLAALRKADAVGPEGDPDEMVTRILEIFERVEHLRGAGVLSADVLHRAFDPVLAGLLADPRFSDVIERGGLRHAEVIELARRLKAGQAGDPAAP